MFSVIQALANVPSWMSDRIFCMAARASGPITLGPDV